ncbi:hypothetical protein JCM11491_006089 [Sporobolomyces phaffii]
MTAGFSTILPADANPYLNLNGAYKSRLILKHPGSANTQLFALSIIHGITILLLIASLIINWWKARFWLIRRQAPSPLLVLNFPVVGAIVATALIAIFEVTLARSMQTFEGWLQKDYGFWLLFSGSTRHLIAEAVIWSLTASTVIRSQLKGPQLKFWSYTCNTIGIVTPLATVIAALVLSILGGIKYSNAVGAYDKLNAFFIEESLTWSPTNLTNRFVPPPGTLIRKFESNLEGIERWWKLSFLFSGIVGSVLTAAVVVVSVLYLFSLRKNVVKMGQTLEPTAHARAEGSRPHLVTTWTLLLGVLVTVILFSSLTLALEFYVYLRPFSFHSRTTAAALLFIPFYLSSVPGLAFSIGVLYSASTAHSSSKDAEKGWKTVLVRRFLMKKRRVVDRNAGGGGPKGAIESSTGSTTKARPVEDTVEGPAEKPVVVLVLPVDAEDRGAQDEADDPEEVEAGTAEKVEKAEQEGAAAESTETPSTEEETSQTDEAKPEVEVVVA